MRDTVARRTLCAAAALCCAAAACAGQAHQEAPTACLLHGAWRLAWGSDALAIVNGTWDGTRDADPGRHGRLCEELGMSADAVAQSARFTVLGARDSASAPHKVGVEFSREALARRELERDGVAVLAPRPGWFAQGERASLPLKVAVLDENDELQGGQLCLAKSQLVSEACQAKWAAVGRPACRQLDGEADKQRFVDFHWPGTYRAQARLFQLSSAWRTVRLGQDPPRTKPRPRPLPPQLRPSSAMAWLHHQSFVVGAAERRNSSGWARVLAQAQAQQIEALIHKPMRFVEQIVAGSGRFTFEKLVAGGVLSEEAARRVRERHQGEVHGVELTAGAVGCALTHISIWEDVARSNRSSIVFEDDVWFSSRFDQVLTAATRSEAMRSASILYLGAPPHAYAAEWSVAVPGAPLRRSYGDNFGAFAYLITPAGARQLLDQPLFPLVQQIDKRIEILTRNAPAFTAYLLEPPVAYELKTLRPSTVQIYATRGPRPPHVDEDEHAASPSTLDPPAAYINVK